MHAAALAGAELVDDDFVAQPAKTTQAASRASAIRDEGTARGADGERGNPSGAYPASPTMCVRSPFALSSANA